MISLLVDNAFQIVWRWCYRMFQFQQLQWSKYLVEHPCRVIGWCGTISESTENFQKLSNGNPEHFQIEDKICLWSSTQVRRKLFLMLALLRRTSFWPPSMVFISVIIIHILQITIFHMLDQGQLSCTASTPVFLTFGFLSCFAPLLQCVFWISYVPFLINEAFAIMILTYSWLPRRDHRASPLYLWYPLS